jgi:hypothetical protein
MPYSLPLPNGQVIENIPDDIPVAQAKKIIVGKLVAQGQLPAEIGDIGSRAGATLTRGIASTLSVVPNLYGAVTGDFNNAPLAGTVKNLEKYAGQLRTPTSTYQQATVDQAVEEAGKRGVLPQVGEVFKQYGSNPTLFAEKLGEVAPDIAAALLTGGATAYATFVGKLGLGAFGKQAAKEGAEALAKREAAKASAQKVGTNVALGQGAVQEGASSAKSTYDEVFAKEFSKLVKSGVPEDKAKAQAQETALKRARAVGGVTAAATFGASKLLPGVEKTIFGNAPAGRAKSAATTGFGEATGETAGAVTGQVAQNIAAEAPVTRNVGRTIGESVAVGGGAGAITGAAFPGRPSTGGLEAEVNRIIPETTPPEVDETTARPTIQPRPVPKPGETLAKTGLITPEEGAEVDRVTAIKDFLEKAETTEGVQNGTAARTGEVRTDAGGIEPSVGVAPSPAGISDTGEVQVSAPDRVAESGQDVGSAAGREGAIDTALGDVGFKTTAPDIVGFTTEKGSTYDLTPDGKTSRTKRSPGMGQGTTYEPHMVMYVAPGDHMNILSDMQGGMGNASVRLGYIDEDNVFKLVQNSAEIPVESRPVVGVFNKKTNEVIGIYGAQITPKIGMHPVEKLYMPDGTSSTHVGNKIVELKTAPAAEEKAPATEEKAPVAEEKAEPTPVIEAAPTPKPKRETKAQRVEREQREADESLKTFAIPRSAPSAGSQQVAKSAKGVNLNQVPELDLEERATEGNSSWEDVASKINEVMSKPGSQRTVEEQAIHAYAAGVQKADPNATIKDVFRYLAYELAEPSSVGAKQKALSKSARSYVEKALGPDATKKLDAAVEKVKENVAAANKATGRLTSEAGLEARRGEEREAKPEAELNLQEMLIGVSQSYEGTRSSGKAVRGEIAKLLSGIGTPPRVVFGEVEGDRAGKFDPATNTITLNKDKVSEDVLLHEAVHAYLDHAIDNPGKLNAKQKKALEELKSLHKLAVDKFGSDFDIGSLKEFAAEAMSNPDLQSQMRQVKVPTKPFTFLNSLARTIAKLLNIPISEEANLFLRSVSEIEQLLSAPTAKVKGKEVSYAPEKKARTFRVAGKDVEIGRPVREPKKLSKRQEGLQKKKEKLAAEKQAAISNIVNLTEGKTGLVIRKLADSRRMLVDLEYKLGQTGKLVFDTANKAFNAVDSALTASSGKTTFLVMDKVKPLQDVQYKIIDAIAKREGSDVKQVFDSLNSYFTVLHEPERRLDKFIRTVSLEPHNEVRRYNIREALSKDTKYSVKETRKMYDDWVELVRDDRLAQEKDISSDEFSVTGMKDKDGVDGRLSSEEAANILAQFKEQFNKDPELSKLYNLAWKTQQELNKVTIEMNREANYGSQGLQNLINARGWKNYVPFRGAPGSEQVDEASNYSDLTNVSGELAQVEKATKGRISAPENVLLRSFAESVKAASRVPKGDVTRAVYNLVKNGQVAGDIKTISYQDRVLKDANPPREDNVVYHYDDNGNLHAIEIKDSKLAESIRGTYTKLHPIIEGALNVGSSATRLQGSFMTRYNPSWWPIGFVTDILTNTFNISSNYGATAAAKYVGQMAHDIVATKGFAKAARLGYLYNAGRIDDIRKLAKPGSWYADALEWLEEGGKISFGSGFSSKSQLEQLESRLSRNPLTVTGRAIDDFVGLVTDSLDISTRVAAYRVFKSQGLPKNKAATEAKELANFERSGDWGRAMGAYFTFFRPSATGATKAIDSITRGKYGKQTAAFAAALGASMFLLTRELSDDDEEGRNRVQEDDGDRSVRRLRIFIPGMENPIQIPWSYGIGGFAAVGYQAAKAASGSQTWTEYLNNTQKILRESFLPLPVSQINPLKSPKNFAAFLVDSILPSTLRPVGQAAFNLNSLEIPIYKEGPSRYAQAYTTGRDIPGWIQDFTKHIYREYEVDIAPRMVHHILSNYVSGLSGVVSDVDGLIRTAKGDKDLTARDIPIVKGFIGTEATKDNKRFQEFKSEISRIENAVNTFKKRDEPDVYMRYLEKHPGHERAVKYFNDAVNDRLNPLYKERNFINAPKSGLNEKERKERLSYNRIREVQAMRSIMEETQWMLAD